ncbi:hypothetical protein LCGC14_2375980 [marine sediment metagenome]|uniref:Uncharacterized protein n=1 Tax=marine sediment metagenome TaxID=412755 RepID=A0A0F9C2H4_9ZZZZ
MPDGHRRPRRRPRELGDECAEPRRQCYKVDRGIQIFSRYQVLDPTVPALPVLPETPPFKTFRFMRSPEEADCNVCRMWLIEVWGNEVDQVVESPALVEQLQPSSIMNAGRQMSRLKIRVIYHASSGGTVRILDIGEGIRFAVEACVVTVEALIPDVPGAIPGAGTGFVGNTSGTLIQAVPRLSNGLILNTLLGGFICETFSPPGVQEGTNTITVRIPQDQVIRTPVPPGSRRVTIYQTPAGDIATPEWLLFDDAAAPSLGQVTIGASRRVVGLDRPGNAEVIESGPSDNVDRVLTYVFSLEI